MKNYIFLLSCLLILEWILPCSVKAEDSLCYYEEIADLPLEDVGGYLLGSLQINGHSVHVIVDTGSEGSLISQQGVNLLHLPMDPRRKTILYGSKGKKNLVHNVFIQNMRLGNYHFGSVSVPVGNLPEYPRVNPPIIGLLGGDILSNFDLEFDVKAKKLSLWDVESRSLLCKIPPFWQTHSNQLSIEQKGYRVFVKVQVDHFPLRALLDSGARSRIISLEKVKKMGIRPEVLATRPGGLASSIASKDVIYHWYQFHRFEIGGQVEYKPVLTVSPLYDDADMLIGSDWFAANKVWISYKREMLFFMKQKP